jgi:hypothetical protein
MISYDDTYFGISIWLINNKLLSAKPDAIIITSVRSRFKGKTEDLASMHRRAYGRSRLEAGHSAVKVTWLVLVTVSILVKGEVR